MRTYSTQIAIVGGGICGLWLLNLLRKAGYSAWLFEKEGLGGGQTLASQGMIHGGLKYALGGFKTPSSESIANMPAVWKKCLAGEGPVDLSGLGTLSEDYHLFSDGALTSKVTAFFASKTIKGRISTLNKTDYPVAFQHTDFQGSLYRLQDIVLDTPSLIRKLAENLEQYIFKGAPEVQVMAGRVSALQFPGGQSVCADKYIFAAGAGNEALIHNTQLSTIKMQTRPLQQVMLKGKLPFVYAHAVSLKDANKPRLTITSHRYSETETIWYLGGNLAELGVNMSVEELIDFAKKEILALLPWINLANTDWATLRVDRAEPAQETYARPDSPFVESIDNAIVCWPTKLTLAPLLGKAVQDCIGMTTKAKDTQLPQLPSVPFASSPWELAFD